MGDTGDIGEYMRVAEFRSALRRFQGRTEKIARAAGLTPQRYVLLLMIKGAPGANERSTVTELADRLQLAQNTVTDLVTRAQLAGLLRRDPSQADRRVTYLHLTAEGERRLARAFTALEIERNSLVASLIESRAQPADPR